MKKIKRLFDSHYYGIEAIQINRNYSDAMKQLIQMLIPHWKEKSITHYCYRTPTLPLHVLASNELEISINLNSKINIPTGFDLKDSIRVRHITIDLKDSVDLLGFIEHLTQELTLSIKGGTLCHL
ncbi:hypothetical protein [Aliivibrio salmonicida]|uniref:hypothetical protein n=1 Tax=Aliivibrio salmonicida TaxID=40269 RepID=UPI003D0A52D2